MIEAPASKSFPAARARPQKNRISPLVWMNLVCLDAPLVAVSWQWLFARSFGVVVPRGTSVALFLTAWLIYLADRLGDAFSLGAFPAVSVRQEFCRRHTRAWIAAVVMIAIADLFVIATQLDGLAISVGAAVGLAALVYLTINRFAPSFWHVLPLKESSIGFIFAAGSVVGLVRGLTTVALPAWLLFAALCALNCISIAVWERELDAAQQRISIATEFPRVAFWLARAAVAVAGVSAAALLFFEHPAPYLSITISALALAALQFSARYLQRDLRTALADLVLLTPLLALLIWR